MEAMPTDHTAYSQDLAVRPVAETERFDHILSSLEARLGVVRPSLTRQLAHHVIVARGVCLRGLLPLDEDQACEELLRQ